MSRFDEIPQQPPESCFEIAALAATRVARLADGNGLNQNQLRLARHDTQVHQLHGIVSVALKPDSTERTIATPPASGQALPSRERVFAEIEGCAVALPLAPPVAEAIFDAILSRPDKGWGLESLKIPLKTSHTFYIVENCSTCSGEGKIQCGGCQGLGVVPCNACQGQGFSPCTVCFGTGAYQKSDGSRTPCNRCNSSGRMPCQICQRQRELPCQVCQGERKTACPVCRLSGKQTRVFQVGWHAEASFTFVRENLDPQAAQAVDKIGIHNIALQKHAEIYCSEATAEGNRLNLSYTAFFPLAKAEFQIAGKPVPADIAGMQARILSIEPFLDKNIKPGILALQKVSKGSFATPALIATACKFKVLRQILSGLGHQPKKTVYLNAIREYPLILSEKYVKAAILYAETALLSLTRGPRLQGLALGAGFSVLISSAWFLTAARTMFSAQLHLHGFGQHILLADIIVWVLCYVASVFIIRYLAGQALRKILPGLGETNDKGLPPAGAEGFWALGATFVPWFAIAALAPERALWMTALLKSFGLL